MTPLGDTGKELPSTTFQGVRPSSSPLLEPTTTTCAVLWSGLRHSAKETRSGRTSWRPGHGKRHKPLAAGQEQALLDAIRAIGANPDVAIRALDHRRYHLACAKKHPELYRHEQNHEKDSDKRY